MLRRGEHHIRNRYGLLKPIAKLNDVMLLDQRFIFDRNEIVNQSRESDPVAALCFGDIFHIVRNAPAGAERDDDIAASHELFETVPFRPHADQIAKGGLEY